MIGQQPFEPLGMPPQPESPPQSPPPSEQPRDPFWSYTDLAIFVGLVIPCLLLGVCLVRGFEFLFRIHVRLRTVELLPAQFLGYGFMFTGLMLLFRWQYGRPFWRSLGWTSLRLSPFALVIAGILTAFGVSGISLLLKTPATSNPMTEMLQDRASLILVAVFGLTIGPLSEELAFRGFLQPLLVRSLGVIPGILAAAVPFGLLHFQEYGNSWRHAVLISLAGAAFGAIRHVTGSTRASTLMHASYNAVFFFALLLDGSQIPHR
jgi:membrane protease YdiL (CAAX protease family)